MEYRNAIPAFNFLNNYVFFLMIKFLNFKTPKNYITSILDIVNVYSRYNYIFHKDIKEIPRKLFFKHRTLKKVVIPNSVIHILSNAFAHTNIRKIVIPDGVVSIGGGSFYACIALKEIIIPKSITGIYLGAFLGCSKLKRVEIHDKKIIKGDICFPRHTHIIISK